MSSHGSESYWRWTDGRYAKLPPKELTRRQKAVYHTEDVVETDEGLLLFLTGAVPSVESEHEGCFLEGIECDTDFRPIGAGFITLMGVQVVRKLGRVTKDEQIFTWMDVCEFLRMGHLVRGLYEKLPDGPLRNEVRKQVAHSHRPQDLTEAPYIPEWHQKYDLLPHSRENGGEVFSYPVELMALQDLLSEAAEKDGENVKVNIMPFGCKSYAEFFGRLSGYADKYRTKSPELADAVLDVIELMDQANAKEYWSVVRYTGNQPVGHRGLTPGRCYYWPCSPAHPIYEGVIDDEETTSYLYPCDPSRWEILEDPTGMAARALAGEADTVDFWGTGPTELDAWADENGITAKRKTSYSMLPKENPWGESEQDTVEITCPECGRRMDFAAWTKVNAQDDPNLVDGIIDGSCCEFTCDSCGYTAHLEHPCLYLDPCHRVCIYHVVSDQMREQVEEMFRGLAEDDGEQGPGGSIRRIVRSREEFQEKVAIITADLDDRAIELLKLGVAGQAFTQGVGPEAPGYKARFVAADADTIQIRLMFTSGRSFVADIPRGGYELFADEISASDIANEQPLYVDRTWAYHTSDVLSH